MSTLLGQRGVIDDLTTSSSLELAAFREGSDNGGSGFVKLPGIMLKHIVIVLKRLTMYILL